jgi:hypothetical protein
MTNCFFCPPHPNGIRISGYRGVFAKLEYLILNHRGLFLMSSVHIAFIMNLPHANLNI